MNSQENETVGVATLEVTNSLAILEFMVQGIPEAEPEDWLSQQRLLVDGWTTAAGAT